MREVNTQYMNLCPIHVTQRPHGQSCLWCGCYATVMPWQKGFAIKASSTLKV